MDFDTLTDRNRRQGTAIARVSSYSEAQQAVDRLADDDDFDVEGVRIVGTDLQVVEYVTGRRGWLSSLARGAGSGAFIGLVLALIIAFFSIFGSIGAFGAFLLWGAVLGAVAGSLWALLNYAMDRGRRDFFSESTMVAGGYDIVVPDHRAEQARSIAGEHALRAA